MTGYAERQSKGEKQKQLSKEFVRECLMENGFQGLEGQTMPVMPDSFVDQVTMRYEELYKKLTGKTIDKSSSSDIATRIENNVNNYLNHLG